MNSDFPRQSSPAVLLSELSLGAQATVTAVIASDGDCDAPALRRMAEIGFLPGEPIRIVARAPGGGPLAVRVGDSTFALRRREAQFVRVMPDGSP